MCKNPQSGSDQNTVDGSPGVQYMDAGAFLPRFLRSVSEKINLCCQEKILDVVFERMQ